MVFSNQTKSLKSSNFEIFQLWNLLILKLLKPETLKFLNLRTYVLMYSTEVSKLHTLELLSH